MIPSGDLSSLSGNFRSVRYCEGEAGEAGVVAGIRIGGIVVHLFVEYKPRRSDSRGFTLPECSMAQAPAGSSEQTGGHILMYIIVHSTRNLMVTDTPKGIQPSLHWSAESVFIIPAITVHFGPSPSTSRSNLPCFLVRYEMIPSTESASLS
jgi:hypothetical protein